MKERVLAIDKSFKLLEKYKIPLAKAGIAKTAKGAEEIARKVGFPVVLKAVSPQLVHKTEANAIILDIKNRLELEKNYRKLLTDLEKRSIKIQGVLVQKMVKDGKETIIGGKKDDQFGQVLMFGGGGVLTEVLEDVSFRVCPISRKDAIEMIEETKYYKVLKGYRGESCDINALIEILLKTSKLLEENQEIVELDINPVIALPKGAVAVDARIVIG